MKVVILSAGMGTRMGKNIPKPLTEITEHKTIMDFQIEKLLSKVSLKDIFVVVGYNKDMIMKKFPNLNYIFNDQFRTTNTSKSLLKALNKIGDEDVLYLDPKNRDKSAFCFYRLAVKNIPGFPAAARR